MNLNSGFKKYNISILKDFTLNIIASVILTAATQLIAYPYLSRILSIDKYGLMLTIIGIINAIGVSLGNPLNNTRILLQSEYNHKNLNGDYNIIFSVCVIIDIFIVGIITSLVIKKIDFIIIGYIFVSILVLFRSYFSASYRIIINYKKNLYASIWGFIGYILGILVAYFTGKWIFVFIFGELISCIYIYFTSNIVHDKFEITRLFKKSLNKYTFIMLAAILSTIITYMDRFFIYPLLGSEQVSIYTVASYLGKTAGIVMNPISGVLLTYYAKETKMTINQFYKRIGLFTIFSILIYFIMFVFGVPITRILYPTLVDKVLPFFKIANLGAILFILGNTIQPILLRYCSAKWQPIIQGIYFVLYLLMGIIGMKNYGLMGFCYATLIVNIIRIFLMVLITTFTLYKFNEKGEHINEYN